MGHPAHGRQEPGRDGVGVGGAGAPYARHNAGIGQLRRCRDTVLLGVPVAAQSSWTARLNHREPAELTIGEVAARLAMPANTVHRWVQQGVVTARKVKVMSQSLWLIHADDAELARLRGRRNQSPVNQNGS